MADENDSVSTAFLKDTFDDIASTIKTAGTNKSSTNTGTGKGGSANFTQLGLTCYSDANNKMSASKRSTFSDLNNAEFAQHCDDFVTYIASLRHPAHSQNVVATNMLAKSGGTGGDVCAFNSSGALIKGSIPTISADNNTPASNKITLYNGANACECLGSPSAVYTGVKVPSGYHVDEKTYTSYLSLYCKDQTLDVYKNNSTYNTKYPYISAGTGVVYDATTNKATHNHSEVTISFPTGYYSGTTFKLQGADLKTCTDITVTSPSATNANNVKIPVGYYGTEVNKCFRTGTATAGTILNGYTAINSTGMLITGNIATKNVDNMSYTQGTGASGSYACSTTNNCGTITQTYGSSTFTVPKGYYASNKSLTITGPALKDAGGVTMVAPTTSQKGYAKVAAGYYPAITSATSIQYNFNNSQGTPVLSTIERVYVGSNFKYIDSDGYIKRGSIDTSNYDAAFGTLTCYISDSESYPSMYPYLYYRRASLVLGSEYQKTYPDDYTGDHYYFYCTSLTGIKNAYLNRERDTRLFLARRVAGTGIATLGFCFKKADGTGWTDTKTIGTSPLDFIMYAFSCRGGVDSNAIIGVSKAYNKVQGYTNPIASTCTGGNIQLSCFHCMFLSVSSISANTVFEFIEL